MGTMLGTFPFMLAFVKPMVIRILRHHSSARPRGPKMAKNSRPTTRSSRVTILDVAKAAGVSKSSVSRLLDERLPRSNSEVAQRVRRVAKELGYVRDVSAANLRRGSTSTIGLIVPA